MEIEYKDAQDGDNVYDHIILINRLKNKGIYTRESVHLHDKASYYRTFYSNVNGEWMRVRTVKDITIKDGEKEDFSSSLLNRIRMLAQAYKSPATLKTFANEEYKLWRMMGDELSEIIEQAKLKNEKNYRSKISYSCPKNIFFWTSWKDFNNNGRYDFNEFNGLNKNAYSLSKDKLCVGINFPHKSGGIIIQSWTKDGKLLGTTTQLYQEIYRRFISPSTNIYEHMDFIDMVKKNGIGEYKITVSFVEGGTYEQKLVIIE